MIYEDTPVFLHCKITKAIGKDNLALACVLIR